MAKEKIEGKPESGAAGSQRPVPWLNILVAAAFLAAGYFAYAYITREKEAHPPDPTRQKNEPLLQLDVLNGSGMKGMASRFTDYLRRRGFDVVESKNYRQTLVPQTLVVDRVGNLAAARKVAAALGLSDRNVIQEINPDYYVNVSVVIGADCMSLPPSH